MIDCTLELPTWDLHQDATIRVPESEFAWACEGADSAWDMVRRVNTLRDNINRAHSIVRASGRTPRVESVSVGVARTEWLELYNDTKY